MKSLSGDHTGTRASLFMQIVLLLQVNLMFVETALDVVELLYSFFSFMYSLDFENVMNICCRFISSLLLWYSCSDA